MTKSEEVLARFAPPPWSSGNPLSQLPSRRSYLVHIIATSGLMVMLLHFVVSSAQYSLTKIAKRSSSARDVYASLSLMPEALP